MIYLEQNYKSFITVVIKLEFRATSFIRCQKSYYARFSYAEEVYLLVLLGIPIRIGQNRSQTVFAG